MRKWLPLVAVCAGTFMLLVDVTIVTVALPEMAGGLDASLSDLQWVLSAYALVLAALVLTSGSIADRVGRRAVYLGGLVGFGAASLACGVSANVGMLIAARGVQGLAAAAMFATTLALISTSYDGRDRGFAFGVWAAVNGAAAAAGPLLGGLLTDSLGWRWIFLVNLPVCVVAVALTLAVVSESRDPRPRRIDLPGMVSFTVAAGALVFALIRDSWGSSLTVALLVVAVVALVGFVAVERARPDAMLDLSLLRSGSFAAVLFTAAMLPAAAWAFLAYQTLWLQSVLGLSPIEAGLVWLPASVTTFVVSIAVGRTLHDASPRALIGTGMLIIAAGAFTETAIGAGSDWTVAVPGLFLVGVGAGLVLGPLSAAAMAAVPGPRAGMAAGAVNTFRQLGFALGIAVLGAVFRSGLGDSVGKSERETYADALDLTFLVATGFGLAAVIAVFAFVRPSRATPTPTPAPTLAGARPR
ncbi:MAG TPA: MFS transporter [Nocardioides sp.]|nr:MFS transporter [Nocardioides sp.]